MSLFNLYDDEVTFDELNQLIFEKICEKRTLDYKQTLELDGDEKKKEFLADITSFANTNGGLLIYGVKEEDGIPIEFLGISSPSLDILKGQIEHIIRDGIEPKLNTVKVIDIKIPGDKIVLVIKIPQSWASPHLVWYKKSSKFFARNSSHGKYQLEISEIRSSIIVSENLYERIRNFRLDRISKLLNNQAPVLLNDAPIFVVNILPFNSFNITNQIDMSSQKWTEVFSGSFYNGFRRRYNYDGYLLHNQYEQIPADRYIQFFRNGEIELVYTSLTTIKNNNKLIYSVSFEQDILNDLPSVLRTILSFNYGFPYVIMLSVLNIKGYDMQIDESNYIRYGFYPIDKENLLIPEILIQNIDELDDAKKYKPLFDPVWHACGFPGSINYKTDVTRK